MTFSSGYACQVFICATSQEVCLDALSVCALQAVILSEPTANLVHHHISMMTTLLHRWSLQEEPHDQGARFDFAAVQLTKTGQGSAAVGKLQRSRM